MLATGLLTTRQADMATRGPVKWAFFAVSDARFLAELPWLWFVAWFLPERRWYRLCLGLERFKARLGWFDPHAVAAIMAHGLGSDPSPDLAIRWAAGRTACHLEVLRTLRPGFRAKPAFEIFGLENLTAAIGEGRGCLLWVAHFCFNSLAVKAAITGAGYRLWHVSRHEHGFSKTRFGMRILNPLRVAAERRYLSGRILIDRANPGGALVAARRTLESGGVVSFTAGAWEGVRPIDIDLLGARLLLSTGAAGLALMTGAPLLPVFATRGNRDRVRIEIGASIVVPPDGTREGQRVGVREPDRALHPAVSERMARLEKSERTGVRHLSGRRGWSLMTDESGRGCRWTKRNSTQR